MRLHRTEPQESLAPQKPEHFGKNKDEPMSELPPETGVIPDHPHHPEGFLRTPGLRVNDNPAGRAVASRLYEVWALCATRSLGCESNTRSEDDGVV